MEILVDIQARRPDWRDYFLDIARSASTRATCPRRHVGAVLVRGKRLLATGYNGSPPGAPHCEEVGCLMSPDGQHCLRTIHAEINALRQCWIEGIDPRGTTMYSTLEPCENCRLELGDAGVEAFVWAEDMADYRQRKGDGE